ncbi:unnamed protein product [Phytomonas sp. Hart1]|nr:unnamed protein product [Phytomonas sp. Hart1]|eukprot:CCW67898.1 unnamed protein product [Phytomonas sp. isolate Hart1]
MSSEECDLLNPTALLEGFYTRTYPTRAELQREVGVTVPEDNLHEIVAELRNEVDLLAVETELLELHGCPAARGRNSTSLTTPDGAPTSSSANEDGGTISILGFSSSGALAASIKRDVDELASSAAAVSISIPLPDSSPARRGKNYQRKTDDSTGRFVNIADKMAMLTKEEERLVAIEKNDETAAEQIREYLIATAEEAARRAKELRLERKLFARGVLSSEDPRLYDGTLSSTLLDNVEASADELLRYLERARSSHGKYQDKLQMQCGATEQEITRALHRLRQHQVAGETFRPVDFEQLGIENEQFNERAEQKSAELVELKGASTRTVQALNATTDALNDLVAEQNQLKKEYKSRCEYLARCTKEMSAVAKEVVSAEKKNEAIRAKHESVRAPTIEEYIAQRAELFELQKAEKNWQRKVEIAQGQMRDLRRKVAALKSKRRSALAYAMERQNQRASNLKAATRNLQQSTLKCPPLMVGQQSRADGTEGSPTQSSCAPLVASSKSLLDAKRQTKR